MKNLLLFLFAGLLTASCGDEGIGFNVGKEFPVTVPISIDIPGNPLGGLISVDPPAESFDYDLNEVGSFSDALDGLDDVGSIIVNSMAYEIQGVASEGIDLELLRISIDIAGSPLTILEITTGGLSTTPYTPIALTETQRSQIIEELFQNEKLNAQVDFDLNNVPSDPNGSTLAFDFLVYFDVTLKARDL